MSRLQLYWLANLGFVLVVAVGLAVGSMSSAHPLYLILLFALCTTPILSMTALNDRFALLSIFCAVYFQFYGTLDLVNLYRGSVLLPDSHLPLNMTELVILVGGGCLHVAYRLLCRSSTTNDLREEKDWTEFQLVVLGGVLWAVATAGAWYFKVYVITAQTQYAVAKGLGSISGIAAIGFVIASTMQPMGILFIAYAQCRFQRAYMLPMVVAMVLVQLALGFIVDSKGDALIGVVLVIVTRLLVNGRVPKGWVVASVTFVILAFPALQANRYIRGQYGVDSVKAAQDVVGMLKEANRISDEVTSGETRSATFIERMTLKGSVHMIVTKVGKEVPYQYGYTLSPLAVWFIPRIIWPAKPDIQTGQIMNKEFRVSTVAYTYISPSHLGELYWNFGWPGVLVGMSLIGALLGFIGSRVDMTQTKTITRLLIAVLTVRMLILAFEGTIAVQYVVWIRAALIIALLHLLFSRRNAKSMLGNQLIATSVDPAINDQVRHPNLLR